MLLREMFTAGQQAEAGKPVFYLKVLHSGVFVYTLLHGLTYIQLKLPTPSYYTVLISLCSVSLSKHNLPLTYSEKYLSLKVPNNLEY